MNGRIIIDIINGVGGLGSLLALAVVAIIAAKRPAVSYKLRNAVITFTILALVNGILSVVLNDTNLSIFSEIFVIVDYVLCIVLWFALRKSADKKDKILRGWLLGLLLLVMIILPAAATLVQISMK